jgi:hypothetical protein
LQPLKALVQYRYRGVLGELLTQHLGLPLDLFYQGGRNQLLGYLFGLLNVNQPYPHHGVGGAAHALQLRVSYQSLGLYLLGIRLKNIKQIPEDNFFSNC